MCRKNRLTGACLVSAGLGMVLTLLLGSSVLAAIAALAPECDELAWFRQFVPDANETR